jgi:acetylornithine deacetylase/succinyl-diaminopimelate desuccinylase-like protein
LDDLRSYIRENSSAFLDDLKKLCSQPSISAQDKGVTECAELLRSMLQEVGFEVKLMPTEGGPVVFATLQGEPRARTLLFYNHYDVQPPDPLQEWKSGPFRPEVREDKFYARGVSDNKGDIVARIEAIKTIQKLRGRVPVNIKFLIEGGEEIGSPHLAKFAKENADLIKADGCLWEGGGRDVSGRPEFYFGMKGILYAELSVKTAGTDQHSMWAPIVANPAWRLAWALNTLKDRRERILIKGWYDDVRPPDGHDMKALKMMALGEETYKKVFGIGQFLGKASGLKLRRSLIFNPTCTICGIESGYTGKGIKTVNPSKASAKVDFRLVPNQNPGKQYQKLRKHMTTKGFGDVEVTVLNSTRPSKTSLTSRISTVANEAAKIVYECEPSVWPLVPGSGPMALFVEDLGIPTIGAGVGYYDSREHAPNENIRVDDFLLGVEHIARVIEGF